jgi:hypothetical protein
MEDMFSWSLTQYAAFNKTDKYLLVCGVNINGVYYSEFFMGHAVVFDQSKVDADYIPDLGMMRM